MREPPKLADADIGAALHRHYGLTIAALTFLPLGNDSASFVYRADAGDGSRYFVKLRTEPGFSPPSLLIPHWLSQQQIPHIMTPLPTTRGDLWVNVAGFVLSVFPLIDARTAASTTLTLPQWQALGATLRQIHASAPPLALRRLVPREQFVPSRRQVLTDLQAVIAARAAADPIQREWRAFWRTQENTIRHVIHRADTLGRELRTAELPPVLCHADLHTWNVLLDAEDWLWIVDWDETILAPKERDLMFAIGGIGQDLVRPDETASFLQGYGAESIDRRAMTYYRYAWAAQDMAAYAEDVFFAPDRGEQTRHDALLAMISLFAPGNIVAIAIESDSP